MTSIPKSIGIHNGPFHADEVTACALLILFGLAEQEKIIRTRDPKVLETCEYVCDVGGTYDPSNKLFDHHQSEYTGPFSSAGMILDYLHKKTIISLEEYDYFNSSLVEDIDDHDNGRVPQPERACTFSHVIANFCPIEYEADLEFENATFTQALNFTSGHLERLWKRFHFRQDSRNEVLEVMGTSDTCLIFDNLLPWQENFFALGGNSHPASFVVMPVRGHWKLRGIPPNSQNLLKVRIPLPEEWAGLLDVELEKISGIKGAIFCHKGRFISIWETKKAALEALDYIMKYST